MLPSVNVPSQVNCELRRSVHQYQWCAQPRHFIGDGGRNFVCRLLQLNTKRLVVVTAPSSLPVPARIVVPGSSRRDRSGYWPVTTGCYQSVGNRSERGIEFFNPADRADLSSCDVSSLFSIGLVGSWFFSAPPAKSENCFVNLRRCCP